MALCAAVHPTLEPKVFPGGPAARRRPGGFQVMPDDCRRHFDTLKERVYKLAQAAHTSATDEVNCG
jgi:hypothetical protein